MSDNNVNFETFSVKNEDYKFLGKTFKAPKAVAGSNGGTIDLYNNSAWKNSGNDISEVPCINLEEYELSFGLWMTHLSRFFNTVKSFNDSTATSPYQLLYQGTYTGFTYVLPYLINQGTIKGQVQNDWGGDETGIGESFAGSFGKNLDRSLGDIGKFFAEGLSYGGAGEKVKRYSPSDNGKSIIIQFPLYNTIDSKKTIRNFEFVTLFTLQNLKTRTSWMTYLPPKIYKVSTVGITGGINMPAAFVSNFDAKAVGPVRKVKYSNKTILIPEAYDITITIKELLPESSNTFAATLGGNEFLVEVIGSSPNNKTQSSNIPPTPNYWTVAPNTTLQDLQEIRNQLDAAYKTLWAKNYKINDQGSLSTISTATNSDLNALKFQTNEIAKVDAQIAQAKSQLFVQTQNGITELGKLSPEITLGGVKSLDIGNFKNNGSILDTKVDLFSSPNTEDIFNLKTYIPVTPTPTPGATPNGPSSSILPTDNQPAPTNIQPSVETSVEIATKNLNLVLKTYEETLAQRAQAIIQPGANDNAVMATYEPALASIEALRVKALQELNVAKQKLNEAKETQINTPPPLVEVKPLPSTDSPPSSPSKSETILDNQALTPKQPIHDTVTINGVSKSYTLPEWISPVKLPTETPGQFDERLKKSQLNWQDSMALTGALQNGSLFKTESITESVVSGVTSSVPADNKKIESDLLGIAFKNSESKSKKDTLKNIADLFGTDAEIIGPSPAVPAAPRAVVNKAPPSQKTK